MLETLSIPSCIERAMTISGLGSGGSFLCWASMLMGASIARAPGSCSQRTGQAQLVIFAGGILCIADCIHRLLHVKMPDFKSRQIPYLAKVGQVYAFGTLPYGKVPQLKIHHPSLAGSCVMSECPVLVALQQRRWKLSRVIGNCIPMRKRHSSHAFRFKSGKQWTTGKE